MTTHEFIIIGKILAMAIICNWALVKAVNLSRRNEDELKQRDQTSGTDKETK